MHAVLRSATSDLSWLLSRGYSSVSALKLVGDRYALLKRQRDAVLRGACSDAALVLRDSKRTVLGNEDEVWIDGFNVLLTLEVALGNGVLLGCRDGCLRDIASVHGTYRRVHETTPAIVLLGDYLQASGVNLVHVVLDKPVSNSARLKRLLEQDWSARFEFQAHLVNDADAVLVEGCKLVASADSQVLDACDRWVNLARDVVLQQLPNAWLVQLVAD